MIIQKHTLNILIINIQSLKSKIDELQIFLSNHNNNYSLLGISEHWLTSIEAANLRIGKFSTVSQYSRNTSIHGGSMVMSHNRLQNSPIPRLEEVSIENHCEVAGTLLLGAASLLH